MQPQDSCSTAASSARKLLHVAVHDVTPAHAGRLAVINEELTRLGLDGRYTMLVVPDYHHRAPLDRAPEFAARLGELAGNGVEMLLHGYFHVDEGRHSSIRARWSARALTAGEGEFLGLSQDETARRLAQGRRMVEDAVGGPIEGFVAPAWLYGPNVRGALAASGFRLAEDHWTIWSPVDGRRLARSPVVSWASRTPGRMASSILWSRLATFALRPLQIVRIGIHPHDFDHPPLVREIRRVLKSFLHRRRPILLRDLYFSPLWKRGVGGDFQQTENPTCFPFSKGGKG